MGSGDARPPAAGGSRLAARRAGANLELQDVPVLGVGLGVPAEGVPAEGVPLPRIGGGVHTGLVPTVFARHAVAVVANTVPPLLDDYTVGDAIGGSGLDQKTWRLCLPLGSSLAPLITARAVSWA